MLLEPTIRPLEVLEAEAVAQLQRHAFPADELMRTIFASRRVDSYLATLIAHWQHRDDHRLLGAFAGGELVGYAHFRRLPDSLHLNQVAVLPSWQGRGVGKLLLRPWKELALGGRRSRLSLTVRDANTSALDWYRRLGFVELRRTYEWERSVDDPGFEPEVHIVDWDVTSASLATFGFAMVAFEIVQCRCAVGWLPERLRADAATPTGAIRAAAHLSGLSRVVVFGPHPPTERHFGALVWMESPV